MAGSPSEARDIIQDLQAELRRSRVEIERLRMDNRDARERIGKPDPRLRLVEAENRRLREELAAARTQRDTLEAAIRGGLERLRRGRR